MKKNVSVHQLRIAGCKVSVTHYRYYNLIQVYTDVLNNQDNKITTITKQDYVNLKEDAVAKHMIPKGMHKHVLPRGGQTLVEITTPDNKYYSGLSICSPKDGFCKKIGLVKALGVALSHLLHDSNFKV